MLQTVKQLRYNYNFIVLNERFLAKGDIDVKTESPTIGTTAPKNRAFSLSPVGQKMKRIYESVFCCLYRRDLAFHCAFAKCRK